MISNLDRNRDNGAFDLTLRIRIRPRPHRSNSLFTKFIRSREPTVVAGAKRGALYAPRGASSKETMGDDETTLELRSTSILSLSSHTRHGVRSAEKANFAGTEKTLFTSEGTKTARDASRKVLRTGRQLYEDATAARLLEGGLKKPTVRGWLGEKFINVFLERLVARTESQ